MAYGDADRAYLLGQDFGVDVTAGAVTVKGQLDEQWEGVLPGQTMSQAALHRSVLIATGSLSLTQGGAITVDGGSYTVIDTQREPPDGRFTRVVLGG